MVWWGWLLIIVGFLVAVGITVWGFWSAFSFKTRPGFWAKTFRGRTTIQFGENRLKIPKQMGVVCLVVGNQWKETDDFWPIYLFGAENPSQAIDYWTKKLEHDATDNHNSPIIAYLQYTNQKLEQISFYILDHATTLEELNQKTKTWLWKTNLKQRGFNKSII